MGGSYEKVTYSARFANAVSNSDKPSSTAMAIFEYDL